MKLKTYVLIAAFFAVLFFAASYFTAQYGHDLAMQQEAAADAATATIILRTVEITSTGFNPSALAVNAGDAVEFVNRDSVPHWPASAQHPTHLVYPEPGGCIGSRFDSCRDLEGGERWSFVFSQKGEWRYHDHLNCCNDSRFFGTVVVN